MTKVDVEVTHEGSHVSITGHVKCERRREVKWTHFTRADVNVLWVNGTTTVSIILITFKENMHIPLFLSVIFQ